MKPVSKDELAKAMNEWIGAHKDAVPIKDEENVFHVQLNGQDLKAVYVEGQDRPEFNDPNFQREILETIKDNRIKNQGEEPRGGLGSLKSDKMASPANSPGIEKTLVQPKQPPKIDSPSSGFRRAERKKAKLRLGLSGPSGCGKTASALLIAYGIVGDWSKIGVIDTENSSAELYVGQKIGETTIGEYNVLALGSPYGPEKYITAIHQAENAGLEVVIIDSLTHAWAGEGGLLDQHGKIADSGKGNSWTAWRTVTPKHNALVEAMLTSKIHIIATIRAKTDYVQEKEDGRTVIKKVGLAPIQREGMEYEMTTFFDLGINHNAIASKDRANLFPTDEYFIPTPDTGKKLKAWLEAN